MASTLEMASFDTWAFHPTFDNSWITETFTKSFTNVSYDENVSFPESPSSFLIQPVSSSGGSDPEPELKPKPELEHEHEPETPLVLKRASRNGVTKKITKRKTRASKRSNVTFINADPANFRQMVQQVTGVRFGSVPGLVLKPESQRVVSGSGHLPTLDTSAFLLDNHQQVVGSSNVVTRPGFGSNAGSSNGPGFDFDGFNCFPTLESWKVM